MSENGAGEAKAVADCDEGDGKVGGDVPGDVVQVVPDVAVHLYVGPFVGGGAVVVFFIPEINQSFLRSEIVSRKPKHSINN